MSVKQRRGCLQSLEFIGFCLIARNTFIDSFNFSNLNKMVIYGVYGQITFNFY